VLAVAVLAGVTVLLIGWQVRGAVRNNVMNSLKAE
jgi:hypothetical protein